jgi:hypothetical protein
MAYIMIQYDRPTDTQHWNNYNRHVRDWIARLLQLPRAASFIAYRTAHQESPDTFTMLESRTMQEAQQASASEAKKRILDELRSVGAVARVLLVEQSPFTPEPIASRLSPCSPVMRVSPRLLESCLLLPDAQWPEAGCLL